MREGLPTEKKRCQARGCNGTVCLWANESLCFKCFKALVGEEEMKRRWNQTHETPWEQVYGNK